ncbi:Phosphoacetylglucosamine mutase [Leucosporidium creatinivorum]|uniref:Phosphoacetylglucosamine mutase n=1 Tax=Leucosporidium creatinivorum TaxID=106004 RepID=A0A1Y2F2A8_9BASI|nr:Phosphoacetylglucosamine mutase [Leucosporidium creatinivorum]
MAAASPATLNEVVIKHRSSLHPRPDVTFAYGTAGFRTSADLLDSVIFRVGLLAALRSKKLGGKVIGVMVTASHNPEKDNGVKLVDPMGEMLHSSWEAYATQLANALSAEALIAALQQIILAAEIDLTVPATVVYGHDTRPSCPGLVKALEDGLESIGVKGIAAGLVTTPQLHYLVRCYNTQGTKEAYGEATLEGYYQKLAAAYTTLAKGRHLLPALTIDCANGVGAPALKAFSSVISHDILPLIITRDDTTTRGALNSECGADYVKTKQQAPPGTTLVPYQRYCSYDGDADRIVYYYADDKGVFHLLDGDKIAGLVAGFIMDLVKEAGLELEVGVVQTAYANGASTEYLTNKVPTTCVPTGVKHLHHAAESYPIGVYFEANGHGTVLFSPTALSTIASHPTPSPALANLQAVTEVINQTVGDALSDMLLVETVLLHRKWGPGEWDAAYTDLPNRLVKVFVKDRYAFSTEDAERKVVTPEGLQAGVEAIVGKTEKGRSFVRPSGTEDCVRVYAEAATRELADGESTFSRRRALNEAKQAND